MNHVNYKNTHLVIDKSCKMWLLPPLAYLSDFLNPTRFMK